MFTSVVPVLYYSPSLINQIAIFRDGGMVVSSTSADKSTHSLSMKAILEKVFIPVKAEGTAEIERSKETQVSREYNELSRAIEIVKEAQKEALNGKPQTKGGVIDTIAYVDGVFKLSTRNAVIDDSILIHVEGKFGKYKIEGQTSVENWASNSMINQLLMAREVNASALVIPLFVKEKTIQVKYVCIFMM